jgi:hypothetical protein
MNGKELFSMNCVSGDDDDEKIKLNTITFERNSFRATLLTMKRKNEK